LAEGLLDKQTDEVFDLVILSFDIFGIELRVLGGGNLEYKILGLRLGL